MTSQALPRTWQHDQDPKAKRLTPQQAARAHCVSCCGGARQGENGPAGCNSPLCPLYHYRQGRRDRAADRSPAKAMRAFCLTCVVTGAEVRRCQERRCPLWPYRFGKNPRASRRTPNHLRKYWFAKGHGVRPPKAASDSPERAQAIPQHPESDRRS